MSHQPTIATHSMPSQSLNTQLLRGIAILSIILHNYTHLMHGAIYENEFAYQAWHVDKLLRYLSHTDIYLPLRLFSFFGHYGVVLFVFLSAYGLEKKYSSTTSQEVRPLPFIWSHYLKLLSMCLVGCVTYILIYGYYFEDFGEMAMRFLEQLSMLRNLQPTPPDISGLTPYWYFGLTLELYIVYRLLLFRCSWKRIVGAILICTLIQAIITPDGPTMEWLRNNVIGSILPFGLGLLYARHEASLQLSKKAYVLIALISAGLIFVTSLSFIPWLFTPIFVCSLGISCVQLIAKTSLRPLSWVGGISAAIFVTHPIVRQVCITLNKQHHLPPYLEILFFLCFALLAGAIFHPILQRSSRLFAKLARP